ncbi:DUF1843 domain-containing protein [Pseudomonas sp. N3-W]|uniref:DUF1843 domain-containing protein n=1 Tax=Pseudomonas fungipugnans TaxID=3024217 RepID=A0ABT6QIV4_9PSED|nr:MULTISPECIES: DUF1843 domain-containing protein [unclassified Pseudomonas]MDI2590814.1 DUF1843 domain-containing protein [Pseudomonas sp. 681]UWF47249.1 DUF1843 domain-containing protein [Pseudomonas sp. N3-W]
MSPPNSHSIPPYGTAIHEAIKKDDLQQMKALLKQRDASKPENSELKSAYEKLAQEVTRREQR